MHQWFRQHELDISLVKQGTTLLVLAIQLALPQVVEVLLQHGADPRRVAGGAERCPLAEAVAGPADQRRRGKLLNSRRLEVVDRLCGAGAPVLRAGYVNSAAAVNRVSMIPDASRGRFIDFQGIRFQEAGPSTPLLECANQCYRRRLPAKALVWQLADAAPPAAQFSTAELLAGLQVCIYTGVQPFFQQLLEEARQRGALDGGSPEATAAAAALLRGGKEVCQALVQAGCQPSMDDVLELAHGLRDVHALEAYLRASGPLPSEIVVASRSRALALWLGAWQGRTQLACPMLQVLVDRARRARVSAWCACLPGVLGMTAAAQCMCAWHTVGCMCQQSCQHWLLAHFMPLQGAGGGMPALRKDVHLLDTLAIALRSVGC